MRYPIKAFATFLEIDLEDLFVLINLTMVAYPDYFKEMELEDVHRVLDKHPRLARPAESFENWYYLVYQVEHMRDSYEDEDLDEDEATVKSPMCVRNAAYIASIYKSL